MSAERVDEVNEALIDMAKDDGRDKLDEGWALRSMKKAAPYSVNAKKFVENKFNDGMENGRKMDPAEAERLMKLDINIKPYERMNAHQIRLLSSDYMEEEIEEDEEYEVEFIDNFGRQK
ncbi:hypothetical protein PMAYCL1PPCAC_10249 [Pristionchus mayeri]|uniref:NAD(P)H-hydrate epimerase n=1 Tax=Pristionchus mayeri TaxID=1317129 RepID=A0AAN5CEK5_9BILA|nr:hypothetical protein PMAYCL1PPCAC_10249 [Pristionchus mayeri]